MKETTMDDMFPDVPPEYQRWIETELPMPTYVYECPKCKSTLQEVRPINKRNAPTPCTTVAPNNKACGAPMEMQVSVGTISIDPAVSVTKPHNM